MKKLYIGNLPFSYTDETLSELFSAHGEVISAVVIKDRFSGRSKGFGFVEMNDSDADAAMAALDQTEVDGRNIKVSEARPKE